MRSVLVLGIGNILMSDDGLGVYVVNQMKESGITLPEGVELVDGGTSGYDLMSVMMNREKIVIVDALKTDDSPGSVYRFTPEYAVESGSSISLHEVGIMDVIRMIGVMGFNPEIEIIGIVPEDINTLAISISNSVKESIPKAVDQILDAVIN